MVNKKYKSKDFDYCISLKRLPVLVCNYERLTVAMIGMVTSRIRPNRPIMHALAVDATFYNKIILKFQ